MDGSLRTDERRALTLMAEGNNWLGAQPGVREVRPRAWVQLSKYRGDEMPVGWDVFENLLSAGYLLGRRRVRGNARQYRLSDAGRLAVHGALPPKRCVPPTMLVSNPARTLSERVSRLVRRSDAVRERGQVLRIESAASLARLKRYLVDATE